MRITNYEVEKKKLCDAVDVFAAKMKAKLIDKLDEGWSEWDFVAWKQGCIDSLLEHTLAIFKDENADQAVDVANFAMFLDHIEAQEQKP